MSLYRRYPVSAEDNEMGPPGKPGAGRMRPSEVALDTKRHFIPTIHNQWANTFPPYSTLYRQPIDQLPIQRRLNGTRAPTFRVELGDPVMIALRDAIATGDRIPFISAANERRPGGDWETGCSGYEENLCRRSNLSATLNSPWPNSAEQNHYPIPSCGGILSEYVVVCRGPHDTYEKFDTWYDLPVVSVSPTRWPKLRENGTTYSFKAERELIRDKIRGALLICVYHNYSRIVIGDFGLGNGYRNPPQELAEIWRDLLLFDPDLRGQFLSVVLAFEDGYQSTTRLILEEIARKESKGRSRGKGRSSRSVASEPSSVDGALRSQLPTDYAIFERAFHPAEIERVVSQPDPRYALHMITT